MNLKIYNTLTRQKEIYQPLVPNKVSMYICGPTVYSDCHIGHIMGPVLFDSIARWFKLLNYEVNFVNNITDIDDKIIKKSLETKEPWQDITARYTQQYFDLIENLNVKTITHFPKCSEYIAQMIEYIKKLIKNNYAYIGDDGVYYSVTKKKDYGKLSGRNLDDILQNNRIEQKNSLKHPADFCLWKLAKAKEPSWESPWGKGRPGWHLECSVMSHALLGKDFDIHGGGNDLKFPHHENEIAQGEAFGGRYAKCWMHNGLIEYEGQKVGKSDPRMKDKNFALQFNAKYLIKTYGADVIRFFILRGHYRRPFDFAPAELEATKKAVEKLKKLLQNQIKYREYTLVQVEELAKQCDRLSSYKKIYQAMNDDFNTGVLIAEVFSLINSNKSRNTLNFCSAILSLIGIKFENKKPSIKNNNQLTNKLMQLVIELRQQARIDKNWELADEIRNKLAKIGVILEDRQENCQWKIKDD